MGLWQQHVIFQTFLRKISEHCFSRLAWSLLAILFIRLLLKSRFLISKKSHFQSFASSEITLFVISEELY